MRPKHVPRVTEYVAIHVSGLVGFTLMVATTCTWFDCDVDTPDVNVLGLAVLSLNEPLPVLLVALYVPVPREQQSTGTETAESALEPRVVQQRGSASSRVASGLRDCAE